MKIYGLDQNQKIKFSEAGFVGEIHDLGICDGKQYFSMSDETLESLPAQDASFGAATADEITALKAVSHVYDSINKDIDRAIRAKYSVEAELKALRVGDQAVQDDIARIVGDGKLKRAEYGF